MGHTIILKVTIYYTRRKIARVIGTLFRLTTENNSIILNSPPKGLRSCLLITEPLE